MFFFGYAGKLPHCFVTFSTVTLEKPAFLQIRWKSQLRPAAPKPWVGRCMSARIVSRCNTAIILAATGTVPNARTRMPRPGWSSSRKCCCLCLISYSAFTLPAGLRELARRQPRLIYDLLFHMSAEATQQLAQDPRFVGGQVGMVGVLHTWGRNLAYHPHVHYLVPAGGLASDGKTLRSSGQAWLPAR